MNPEQRLTTLLMQDAWRMNILRQVRHLGLPNCYVAAGFVRNLIWDHLYQFKDPTPLNDIDVIYFSHDVHDADTEHYELQLKQAMPDIAWQVKNQATMHQLHGHQPYTSIVDAMRFWPEQETAIAVRLMDDDRVECLSVFGFDFIFAGYIQHNPNAPLAVFEQRVQQKQWQRIWPKLKLKYS